MYISNSINNSNNVVFSSKKIPRYLYHMTTKTNAEKIKQSGFINLTTDYLSGKQGVYLFEMQNFIRQWGGLSSGNKAPYLSKKTFFKHLLRKKPEQNISVLRIDTRNLDENKLFIRSQDILFDVAQKYESEYRPQNPILLERFPHLFNFDKAKNTKRYKSKRHSIEFVYTDKIQINNVEEIGNGILRTNTCRSKYTLLRFLKEILSNTNEAKHLKIYDV